MLWIFSPSVSRYLFRVPPGMDDRNRFTSGSARLSERECATVARQLRSDSSVFQRRQAEHRDGLVQPGIVATKPLLA